MVGHRVIPENVSNQSQCRGVIDGLLSALLGLGEGPV